MQWTRSFIRLSNVQKFLHLSNKPLMGWDAYRTLNSVNKSKFRGFANAWLILSNPNRAPSVKCSSVLYLSEKKICFKYHWIIFLIPKFPKHTNTMRMTQPLTKAITNNDWNTHKCIVWWNIFYKNLLENSNINSRWLVTLDCVLNKTFTLNCMQIIFRFKFFSFSCSMNVNL